MGMEFSEFRSLDDKSLIDYIKTTPSLSSVVGNNFADLTIKEVGDDNPNFFYVVVGSSVPFVIKQALPYLGCIETWPMTKERAYFETLALKEHGRLCPQDVPQVYHSTRTMSLIGM